MVGTKLVKIFLIFCGIQRFITIVRESEETLRLFPHRAPFRTMICAGYLYLFIAFKLVSGHFYARCLFDRPATCLDIILNVAI